MNNLSSFRAVGGVGSDNLGGPDDLAGLGGVVGGSKADEGSGGSEELHFELRLVVLFCVKANVSRQESEKRM